MSALVLGSEVALTAPIESAFSFDTTILRWFGLVGPFGLCLSAR